jgi:hypothetical protein
MAASSVAAPSPATSITSSQVSVRRAHRFTAITS